ncbi:MAG: phage tail protein [Xenococcus sp. (in: cyanobacteria)]
MSSKARQSPSQLLDYLPLIHHTDPFLGQFLLAFEKILLGIKDDVKFPPLSQDIKFQPQGLETTIAEIATLFDPQETPEEFLSWLASWTALSLRADLAPGVQRDFVASIVKRYRFRGTKENLIQLLKIFTKGEPIIKEPVVSAFQVGVSSTVGQNTYVGGGPAHFFEITIALPRASAGEQARQEAIARAIIELEKPAHTYYKLNIEFPSMQIGKSSTVGINTLLGILPETTN